jgi:hypothetical protein
MPEWPDSTVPGTGDDVMTVFTKRAVAICWILAGAAVLAGCALTQEPQIDENKYPAAYKQQIVDTLTKLLDDPTNLRDTGVSDPVLRDASGVQRYVNCVRFNPRNANHTYTGVVERVGFYYAGNLTQLVKPTADECRGVAYKPFPELEKICFGTRCS